MCSSALFGIFVVLLSVLLYSSTSNLLLNSSQKAFPTRARTLRTLLIQEVCSSTTPEDPGAFLRQNLPIDVDQVFLLDKNGLVSTSSDGSLLHQPFPYVNSSFFTSGSTNQTKIFTGPSFNNMPSTGLLLPLTPTPDCASPHLLPAYIALLTTSADEQNTLNTILLMLGITSALMIGSGALMIALFTGVMVKPLHQVTRATRALAQGDLPVAGLGPLGHGHQRLLVVVELLQHVAHAHVEQAQLARQVVAVAVVEGVLDMPGQAFQVAQVGLDLQAQAQPVFAAQVGEEVVDLRVELETVRALGHRDQDIQADPHVEQLGDVLRGALDLLAGHMLTQFDQAQGALVETLAQRLDQGPVFG